jgi:hypothetical protein
VEILLIFGKGSLYPGRCAIHIPIPFSRELRVPADLISRIKILKTNSSYVNLESILPAITAFLSTALWNGNCYFREERIVRESQGPWVTNPKPVTNVTPRPPLP